MVGIEEHHFGTAPRRAARLDGAGGGVCGPHEGKRAGGRATARKGFAGGPQAREIDARPRSALEDNAFLPVPIQDGVHVVVHGNDEAGTRLRRRALHPDVEPHRRVERRLLVQQNVGQLMRKNFRILLAGKIPVVVAPSGDGAHDPVEHLAHRAFAPGGIERSAEILRGHHVGCQLRPRFGEFHVTLFEHRTPIFTGDHGVAIFPRNGVVRTHVGMGEIALHRQAGRGVRRRRAPGRSWIRGGEGCGGRSFAVH